jgi:DNA invertase Pin-like site-specific DNA recombinase
MLQQYRIAKLTNGMLIPDEVDPKINLTSNKGRLIGYIRISTGLNPAMQLKGIKLDRTFTDSITASKCYPNLEECLGYLRIGDILHVHSGDRIARSVINLNKIVTDLVTKGITVKLIEENLTFTMDDDPTLGLPYKILNTFAQAKSAIIKEEQQQGIAYAQAHGTKSGRPFGTPPDMNRKNEAIELCKRDKNITEIERAMKLSRSSIYQLLNLSQSRCSPT